MRSVTMSRKRHFYMSDDFRIAFFGLPLAAHLLGSDGHDLALAVLSPMPAPGRRRVRHALGDRVIDTLAHGPELSAEIEQRLAAAHVDLLVSWFWTRRLPATWLALPRLGAIGAHPSLLPRHRGPDPYYAAIDAGDIETGVSIHRLTAAYDEGEVLLRAHLEVGTRNAWQLARALDRPSLALLREGVRRLARGELLQGEAQDERLATWAGAPVDEALRADFRWPAERVLRRLRALSPVPGLALEVRGLAFFATRARVTDDFPQALVAGEAAVVPPGVLVIRCGSQALVVERATLGENQEAPGLSTSAELDERTLGRLIAPRIAAGALLA